MASFPTGVAGVLLLIVGGSLKKPDRVGLSFFCSIRLGGLRSMRERICRFLLLVLGSNHKGVAGLLLLMTLRVLAKPDRAGLLFLLL